MSDNVEIRYAALCPKGAAKTRRAKQADLQEVQAQRNKHFLVHLYLDGRITEEELKTNTFDGVTCVDHIAVGRMIQARARNTPASAEVELVKYDKLVHEGPNES